MSSVSRNAGKFWRAKRLSSSQELCFVEFVSVELDGSYWESFYEFACFVKLILQGTAIKKRTSKYWMYSHDPTKVAEVMFKVFTRDIVPNTLQK